MDEKRFEDRDEEALKVDRNRTALRARRCLTRIVAVLSTNALIVIT